MFVDNLSLLKGCFLFDYHLHKYVYSVILVCTGFVHPYYTFVIILYCLLSNQLGKRNILQSKQHHS